MSLPCFASLEQAPTMINQIRRAGFVIAMAALLSIVAEGKASSQVTLVQDGKIRAVVVTAVKPSQVATYAVEELVNHVKKATGQQLPVAVETDIPAGYDSRVFVGVSEAARKQGIDADKLAIEEYVLRTVGNDLYIVGKELYPEQYHGSRPLYSEPWNPLSMECVHSGTLLGVYEVLEDCLGVRWLWPGDLGTYVPRRSTIVIPATDETVKPRLLYRNLGGWDLPQIFLTGSYFGQKSAAQLSRGRIVGRDCRQAGVSHGRGGIYLRQSGGNLQSPASPSDPDRRTALHSGFARDRGRHRLVGQVRQGASGMVCHACRRRTRTQNAARRRLDSAVRFQSPNCIAVSWTRPGTAATY